MAWYWIVLIIVSTQAIFLLAIWLIMRSGRGGIPSYAELLERSTVKRMKEERDAEEEGRNKAELLLKELAEEKRKLDLWYNKHSEQIDEEAASEYRELASDPKLLDDKLDSLLGLNSEADNSPTDTEDPPNEG